MADPAATGYAALEGVNLYWERYGSGGTPLVLVHGGYGLISDWGELLDQLATRRAVVALELQGHGHTRDTARPFSWESFGDDIAGVIRDLELGPADLLGYSLGASPSLRAAIQHPELIRRLALVSIPFARRGWYPEVRAGFDQMSDALFDQFRHAPMYQQWLEVAPDVDAFPTLMNKTGDLLRRPYDWSADVPNLEAQTLLVYGDADSVAVAHVAEFYALLGGGLHDAGVDASMRSPNQLAILPGATHYDVTASPSLGPILDHYFA